MNNASQYNPTACHNLRTNTPFLFADTSKPLPTRRSYDTLEYHFDVKPLGVFWVFWLAVYAGIWAISIYLTARFFGWVA